MKDKSPSHEYLEAKFKAKFKEMNALQAVNDWLENNPPPPDWQAGRYAWAWTEMPIYFLKKPINYE